MKKFLFAGVLSCFLIACGGKNNSSSASTDSVAPPPPDAVPLTVGADNVEANNAFHEVMLQYVAVHDALVNWDEAKATEAAKNLSNSISKFPFDDLKADDVVVSTAKSLMENVKAGTEKIVTNKTIEQKRRAFASVSDNLYNVARTIQYSKEPLYKVTCPMAFNDEESANWISKIDKVVNPYLGTKHPKYKGGMLECGEVTDSLKYSK